MLVPGDGETSPAVGCNQGWKGVFGNLPATCQGDLQQEESRLPFHGGEVLVT